MEATLFGGLALAMGLSVMVLGIVSLGLCAKELRATWGGSALEERVALLGLVLLNLVLEVGGLTLVVAGWGLMAGGAA